MIRNIVKVIALALCGLLIFSAGQAGPRIKRVCTYGGGVTNTIYWMSYSDTCQQLQAIYVYARENSTKPFLLIDSVKNSSQSSYDHINASAFVRGCYFLVYKILCGASVYRNSDTVCVDSDPPSSVEPDSVSIDAKGQTVIGWTASSAPDEWYYVIYHTTTVNNPVDTSFGRLNTFYTDKKYKPGNGPQNYCLAAADSCQNISPIGNIHRTIFLSFSVDTCKEEVHLQWSPYVGWPVDHYDIFYSKDSLKGYSVFASTSKTGYVLQGLHTDSTYYFFVRAYRAVGKYASSSSNRVSLFTSFQPRLSWLYLKKVTVDGKGVDIEWVPSSFTNVSSYKVLRGKSPGQLLAIADVSGSGNLKYTDFDLDNALDVFFYKVIAFSTCNKEMGRSNISPNMVLTLKKEAGARALSWTPYTGWGGGVLHYEIYREADIPGQIPLVKIGEVSAAQNSFQDADTVNDYSMPGVCYHVTALEGPGNPYGFSEESNSNTSCYIDPPIAFIPNVFIPDGINNIFAPVLRYVDEEQSMLMIYNRWGELILSRNNPGLGWDGTFQGKPAESGIYTYLLQLKGMDGSRHYYRGTLSLL